LKGVNFSTEKGWLSVILIVTDESFREQNEEKLTI